MKTFNLKRLFIYILCFSCFACNEEKVLDMNSLEEAGYKKSNCDHTISYEQEELSIIETSVVLNKRESFILARCFNKSECLLSAILDEKEIICQRYIVEKKSEDKREYLHDIYKEYDNHEVLYKIVLKEDLEKILKRAKSF